MRDRTPGAGPAQQLTWCDSNDKDCSSLRLETVVLDADTTGVLVTTVEGYETLYYGWRLIVPSEDKLEVRVRGEAGNHSLMYEFSWGFVDDGKSLGYYFLQYEDVFADSSVEVLSGDWSSATYETKRWDIATKRFVPAKTDPIPLWALLAAREADPVAFHSELARVGVLLPNLDKGLNRAERLCNDIRFSVTRSAFHRLPPALYLYGKISPDKKALEDARRAFRRCAPTLQLQIERLR